MKTEKIYFSEQLSDLIKTAELSDNAAKFVYLTWLGLSPAEMSTAYYNSSMKMIEWNDGNIFVNDDSAAELLSSFGSEPLTLMEISAAENELRDAEVSVEEVYRSGFFNMRRKQAEIGQPEDVVRVREMSRRIGLSGEKMKQEYEVFCKEAEKLNSRKQ